MVAFLTHLAVEGKVSASTQTQALCALLFLYRTVLEKKQTDTVDLEVMRSKSVRAVRAMPRAIQHGYM